MDNKINRRHFFMSETHSDFVIIIGNYKINAHKTILTSCSEYFKALFNIDCIESKLNEVILKDTPLDAFKMVLKVAYDAMEDTKWEQIPSQELFDAMIVANRFQFLEAEKILSDALMHKIDVKKKIGCDKVISDCSQDHIFSSHWRLYERAAQHNLEYFVNKFLLFIDSNASQLVTDLTYCEVSCEKLADLLKRDTFGVEEMVIFEMVKKWIERNPDSENVEPLVNVVRLELFTNWQLNNRVKQSGLFDVNRIDTILEEGNQGAKNCRVCCEPGRIFEVSVYDISNYSVSPNLFPNGKASATCITVNLLVATKINHIKFHVTNIARDEIFYHYIEIFTDSNVWQKISEESTQIVRFKCQDFYFDPKIIRRFRIIGQNRDCIREFLIGSLSYEFSPEPVHVLNDCVLPAQNVNEKYDAKCLVTFISHFGQSTFDFTSYVLRDTKFEHFVNDIVQYLDERSRISDETVYLIRLPNAVSINYLQIHLLLESNEVDFRNEKLAARCKVEICSSVDFIYQPSRWGKIEEKSCMKSGWHNIEFDLQQVALIKISGYRFKCEGIGKLPLHISRVKVPGYI